MVRRGNSPPSVPTHGGAPRLLGFCVSGCSSIFRPQSSCPMSSAYSGISADAPAHAWRDIGTLRTLRTTAGKPACPKAVTSHRTPRRSRLRHPTAVPRGPRIWAGMIKKRLPLPLGASNLNPAITTGTHHHRLSTVRSNQGWAAVVKNSASARIFWLHFRTCPPFCIHKAFL